MAIYKKVFISLSFLLIGIGSIAALKPQQELDIICKDIVNKDTKLLEDIFVSINQSCNTPGHCSYKLEKLDYKCWPEFKDNDATAYAKADIKRIFNFKWELATDVSAPFELVTPQMVCEKVIWTYSIIEDKTNPHGYALLQTPQSKIIELSLCK